MTQLILIRHSQTAIQAGLPASAWPLSEEGIRRCRVLGERLQPYGLQRLIASQETKAAETARHTAAQLDLPWETWPGLEEQHRQSEPFTSQAEFSAAIQRLFESPEQQVYGEESGEQACQRFEAALQALLRAHPGAALGIVTHGTVLTLWVSHRFNLPAFPFWRQLGLPAFLVVTGTDEQPAGELLEFVPQITR